MADDISVSAGAYTATVATKDVGSGREVQWVLQWVPAALATGRKSGIGTSAVQITSADTPALTGVVVKAGKDNVGTIYVGPAGVTADAADATDGYQLLAGEQVTVPVNNANLVYVIADTTAQKVFWAVV